MQVHPGRSMTIVVVDDESESRKLLTAILTAEGYVRPADNGALALASIAVERPELILLDIHMPEIGRAHV